MHGGLVDPQAIGRKGGLSKETGLRKSVRVDDELREQARDVLKRALAGEQVDREALAAARSLFSYRPNAPALGEQAREHEGRQKIITLVDLVIPAIECGMIEAERGGAIMVGGHRVGRIDPRIPLKEGLRESFASDSPAVATLESPQQDLAEFVGDPPPEFDESEAAKLTRRYGDDTAAGYRW